MRDKNLIISSIFLLLILGCGKGSFDTIIKKKKAGNDKTSSEDGTAASQESDPPSDSKPGEGTSDGDDGSPDGDGGIPDGDPSDRACWDRSGKVTAYEWLKNGSCNGDHTRDELDDLFVKKCESRDGNKVHIGCDLHFYCCGEKEEEESNVSRCTLLEAPQMCIQRDDGSYELSDLQSCDGKVQTVVKGTRVDLSLCQQGP